MIQVRKSQNICRAVERHFNKCTLHADNGVMLCHTMWTVKQDTMRKIERQMCDAIANEQDWRKDNTEVINFYNDDKELVVTSVYLHGNLISEVTNNAVTIFDGGWQSVTTKSRLNAIINRFCNSMTDGVYQRQHVWYLKDNNVERKFVNGYTFA